ncbi:NTP transferase domain-containing protein [Pedobacter petrophilus]|uniref:NTP transferase domain-containing protein n=1 Tax=Pedobacter petrophilus TaxID=1908241 RepID=A0A7K0G3J3_9SPHI|nr:nucleotidyltransferase family protein [Pedobacter petrophilus]MRX77990.1 NTP transferase domain-containing protein [Pedobacter petrophilus]
MNTGIIILAAGNSSRLGRPKQLLKFKDKTLIELTIDAALKTPFKPIVVVLGAFADRIQEKLSAEIQFIINERWQEGMASGIAAGLAEILKHSPELENIMIAVSDQPFINAKVLLELQEKQFSTKKGIIASRYAQTTGTPALFNKKYFPQLLSLTGNNGAKSMLKLHDNDVETVAFALGNIDIDTENDYHNLIHN